METASLNMFLFHLPISLFKLIKKPEKRVYILQANYEACRNDRGGTTGIHVKLFIR